MNHDFGANWTISNNWIHHNDGAGLFIGTNNVATHNCLERNGQYGFQGAGSNLLIDRNEISNNNTADWEAHVEGCGCTGGGKFWDVDGATITNNYVHDNFSVGLWADTNDRAFEFSGNYISGNWAQGIFYEISYNAKITNNTFVGNGLVTGPTNPSFPTAAIYLSESGGDTRISGGKFSTLDISGNVFTDNWSGVILWENADRFCNSPANTSAADCTIVNPGITMTSCSAPTINGAPYYDDCRWKTQNVSVHDNTFNHNPGAIAGCSPSTGCGYNGIFSNWGTFPSWSPYQGQEDSRRDHLLAEQRLCPQHLQRPLAIHGPRNGDGHQLHDLAGRSLQPRQRQHDQPMTETRPPAVELHAFFFFF